MSTIKPFRIDIPQTKLDDLADRLRRSLWPSELPGVGDSYGVPGDRVRRLAQYWLDIFDWRALARPN
ncbi:epoxide hydrolase N-terminal domain-containing protein [Nocardia asiatica]|uniref:epoxide hydrolase N-terminal domain-containing protein n=1 Tax=Nocardia asiatica TaxID=209252 RepID=UPI00313EC4CC